MGSPLLRTGISVLAVVLGTTFTVCQRQPATRDSGPPRQHLIDACQVLRDGIPPSAGTSGSVSLVHQESQAAGKVCWLDVTPTAASATAQTRTVVITDTLSADSAQANFDVYLASKCELPGRCDRLNALFPAVAVHDCSAEYDTYTPGCQPRIVHWVVSRERTYVITVQGFFSPVDVPTAIAVISTVLGGV